MVEMNFERNNMKKLATLLLISTFALGGCTSIQRALRGDDYVDSKIAAEESSKATAQAEKELKDALTNENANFPQLSKEDLITKTRDLLDRYPNTYLQHSTLLKGDCHETLA